MILEVLTMEYKVLYRKYRPDNFESIIGQDVIINTLKNAIKSNKVAHAYIFSGPRGTGKTSTAKVFAKALNCLDYNDGPCNKCDSCLNISSNPDIIEIDAASNNGVDDVRELINNVRLAPSMSKYKVYIIDEVHMLTPNAFNALLLTLEEPPSNVVFIFATTNIENVPITILSRCQRFDFSQISMDNLKSRLKYVIKNEKIDIDDDAIDEICSISEGGLRDALGILDQISSQNDKITIETVQNSFNIIGNKTIIELLKAFESKNSNELIKIIDDIQVKGYDFKNVVKKIIEALYLKLVNDESNVKIIKNLVFDLNKLLNEVNIYVNPYVLLKVEFISLMGDKLLSDTENSKTVSQISEDLPKNELEEEKAKPKISENYFPGNNFDDKFDKFKKIRINNTFVDPKKDVLKETQNCWNEMLKKLTDESLMSLLVDSKVAASSINYSIISTDLEATAHLINTTINKIEEMFKKSCKKNVKFICVTNDEWKELKQEYVKKTKNNQKYVFVEEEKMGYNDEELRGIAEDVFKNVEIEME